MDFGRTPPGVTVNWPVARRCFVSRAVSRLTLVTVKAGDEDRLGVLACESEVMKALLHSVLEEKRYQRRVWTAEGDTLIGSFVVFLAG
jgi:hypothetical protein